MPPGSSATPLPKHICHVLSLVDTSDQPTPTSETLCHAADAVMWIKRVVWGGYKRREVGGGVREGQQSLTNDKFCRSVRNSNMFHVLALQGLSPTSLLAANIQTDLPSI